MQRRRTWLGIALVLIGLGLILHRVGFCVFGGREIFWSGVALAGCGMVYKGWTAGGGKRIFWGALLAIVGVIQLLVASGLVWVPGRFWVPLLLIAIGAAIAARCARTPRDWHLFVPAAGFLLIGSAILLLEAGIISGGLFHESLWVAGPITMALFGAALLANRKSA